MDIEQWFYSLPVRLRSFFHGNQVDEELKEEVREHLEHARVGVADGSWRRPGEPASPGHFARPAASGRRRRLRCRCRARTDEVAWKASL